MVLSGLFNIQLVKEFMSIFPVQITSNPSSQSVVSGQTATFSVIAEGAGTLYYMWSTSNERILNESALAYSNSILSPIEFFQIGSGFIEPAGIIPGATNPTYTTPVLQASDTGSQFTCYVIQLVAIPQSVGGPNVTNTPQAKVVQTFSFATSSAAIVTVIPTEPILTILFSDNFQRANEDPLSSPNWEQNNESLGVGQLQVLNDVCAADSSLEGTQYCTAFVPLANQYASVTLGQLGGAVNLQLRTPNISGFDGYSLTALQGSLILGSVSSGVPTLLSQINVVFSVGDIIALAVVGSTLYGIYNGTVVIRVVDTTFTAVGNIGLLIEAAATPSDTTVTLFTAGTAS
jgi:hypothetical protein